MKTTMLIAHMLQSWRVALNWWQKLSTKGKVERKKTLITEKEMWKRTGIAHSALLPSKEEMCFIYEKTNFRESTTQLNLEIGLKDLT